MLKYEEALNNKELGLLWTEKEQVRKLILEDKAVGKSIRDHYQHDFKKAM